MYRYQIHYGDQYKNNLIFDGATPLISIVANLYKCLFFIYLNQSVTMLVFFH